MLTLVNKRRSEDLNNTGRNVALGIYLSLYTMHKNSRNNNG